MNTQIGFEFNQNYCVGCQACEVACQVKNNVDAGVRWRKVTTHLVVAKGREVERFLSLACNHCAQPACLPVCPKKAISKRTDGAVIIDRKKCIGCGKCTDACPWGVPIVNVRTEKAEKCDFCVDLVDRGEPPACVRACPVQILKFGSVAEMSARGLATNAVGFRDNKVGPSVRFAKARVPRV
jgi:Fe-S-cluster-containing dehydrogenase component